MPATRPDGLRVPGRLVRSRSGAMSSSSDLNGGWAGPALELSAGSALGPTLGPACSTGSAGSLAGGAARRGGCFVTRRQACAAIALAVLAGIALTAAVGMFFGRLPPDPDDTDGPSWGDDGAADERLPRGVEPVRYRLHLWPVLDEAPAARDPFTFEGRLALTVKVVAADGVDRISLHAAGTLTVREDGVVVAEASPAADALADTWDSFPEGTAPEHSPQDGDNDTLTRLPLDSVTRTPSSDLLELHARGLAGGGLYTVFLRFNGTLGDSLSGLYRSSYVDHATQTTRWLAATHMQPTYAREAFPCMDEPAFRAPFRVSLASAGGATALANAPLASSAPIAGVPGWRWNHFEESVAMPSYLVAFAVTDFSHIVPKRQRLPPVGVLAANGSATTASRSHREVEIRLWARPSVLRRGRYAVELAPVLLEYYGDYFSVEYPLPKMDLLALPDFEFKAMENWGLVIFREANLLVDAQADGADAVELVAESVAHELAHQWLGNLVTAAWWDELWLNEGFATYVQTAAVDHVEPTWGLEARFAVQVAQPTLLIDASNATRALAAGMRSKNDIAQAFDSIAYDKGACLLRMLQHSLGAEVFRRGAADYMKTWQHNSTTESRLWEPLTQAVRAAPAASSSPPHSAPHQRLPDGATVAGVMSSWTRSPGYPVVNVSVDRAAGSVVFTQERFLGRAWERNSSRPFSGPELWPVPLSMATRAEAARDAAALSDTRPRAWLVGRTLTLDLGGAPWSPKDWVVVNLLQTGYFRVNYDLAGWRLLAAQLRAAPDALPGGARAQLLGDALSLAAAGLLPYDAALDLTAYLPARERAPAAWTAALSALGVLHRQLYGHPDLVLFERYMQRLLKPMWERVAPPDPGTASAEAGDEAALGHGELQHRAEVAHWACKVHVQQCEDWARRAIHLWRLQPDPDSSSTVPVMLRYTAYCSAVATGPPDVWDFMWQRYLGARAGGSVAVDHQTTILRALACSPQPARIVHLLGRSLDDGSDIRQQDVGTVWTAVATKPVGSVVEFRYFRENWPRIHGKFGASSPVSSAVISAVSLCLSSEVDLRDLAAFRAEHGATLAVASRSLDSAAEEVRTSAEWARQHLPAVKTWIEAALRNPLTFS